MVDTETQTLLERAADCLAYSVAQLKRVQNGDDIPEGTLEAAIAICGECFEDIAMLIDIRDLASSIPNV